MKRSFFLVVAFTLFSFSLAQAGPVGIVEYGDSLSNRLHAAVLVKEIVSSSPNVCYRVCGHDEEPTSKCKVKKFCMEYKDFESKLAFAFKLDQFQELNAKSKLQQAAIEKFRNQIERNIQTNGSFAPTEVQKKQYDDRLKAALKESDDLQNQIATLKNEKQYLAYRDILQSLNDGDPNEEPDFFIDKTIHNENWKKVVSLFSSQRAKEICLLGIDATRACLLHLNGEKLASDTSVDKSKCSSTDANTMIARFRNSSSVQFQREVVSKCQGYYEIGDYGGVLPGLSPDLASTKMNLPKVLSDVEFPRKREMGEVIIEGPGPLKLTEVQEAMLKNPGVPTGDYWGKNRPVPQKRWGVRDW